MTEIVPLTDLVPPSEIGAENAAASTLGESIRGGVITIGNFDGVHLGHAALLGQVRALANQQGGPAVAVVFDPHPASILRPEKAPVRLTWIERRAELMDGLGIDALVVCETTKRFLNMTATEFFHWLIAGHLQARAVVEGPNFFFGRDRGGDVGVLGELCRANKIDLRIVQPTLIDDQMISSTRIRELLDAGNVEEATRLLGAPYRIRGCVARGAGRGRQIGFPTANLADIDVVVPSAGVYGGIATIQQGSDGRSQLPAAIHIGPNPTFETGGDAKVEVHLMGYDGDLYDQTLLVDFVMHVRDIARFDSAERLVEQLRQDITAIRRQLGGS